MKITSAAFVPSGKARALIDLFEVFIDSFCPDYGPLRSAFQLVADNDLPDMPKIPESAFASPTLQDEWADSYKDTLMARIGLSHWDVQFIGMDQPHTKRPTDREFHFTGQQESRFKYYTDNFGRPVIYFDRLAMTEPGYMALTLTSGLTKILLATEPVSQLKTNMDQIDIIHSLAAFLGLGLVTLLDASLTSVQKKQQILSSMLYLRLKGYSIAKIKVIYSQLISAETLEQLEKANRHLDRYTADIERLRSKAINTET